MDNNKFLKLLCSLPIILIAIYFIPFLGICLILFRYYMYKSNKYYNTPIYLLICGLILLIPYTINFFTRMLNIEVTYINNLISSNIYGNLINYSKRLITISIIFLILSVILKNIFNKVSGSIRNYIEQDLKKDYEIRKENDLKMQEKREKAKNTHVVHCPYCGSDNMLTEKIGTCKFCRRKIEYKQDNKE